MSRGCLRGCSPRTSSKPESWTWRQSSEPKRRKRRRRSNRQSKQISFNATDGANAHPHGNSRSRLTGLAGTSTSPHPVAFPLWSCRGFRTGGLCHPAQSVLLLCWLHNTPRYFTVAAGNCVGLAFPAPAARWANPSTGADPTRHGFEMGSSFMRGSADIILPLPQRCATAPRREPLIALIVIGISFGTGYVGSLAWPLPMRSAPPPSAAMTASPEPKDALSAQPRLPAWSPSHASSPQLAATPNVSQAAALVAQSTGSSKPRSYAAPIEALKAQSKPGYRTIEHGPPRPAGLTMVRSAHLSRPRPPRRTLLPAPSTPQFAPNPRPNQPSRDFMAYRSTN